MNTVMEEKQKSKTKTEWETVELNELCEITSSTRIYASEYQEEGVPFYRGKEIIKKQKGERNVASEKYISEERFNEIKKERDVPEKGDLLLTSVGTLGVPYVVEEGEKFYFKDGNLIWFKEFKDLLSEYLYYWFLSYSGKAQLKKGTIGSSQSAYTITNLKKVEIALPPLKTQQKIAEILSAFDDLIENNKKRIEILEEMARTIYREWFVNFNFPGSENVEMKESELGLIPEDFEVVNITEAVNINPRIDVPEGEKHYVPMANVPENSMIVTYEEFREGKKGKKFQNKDTLFARITPSLENGKTGFVQFLPTDEHVALGSTEFFVFRSKNLCPEYVYCLARDDRLRGEAINSMTGTSGRQRVNKSFFDEFKITQPPENLIEKYHKIVAPMFETVQKLVERNKTLRQTRDLLLPRLISGEINV